MDKQRLKDILKIVNLLLDYSNNAIIKDNFIKGFKNNTVNGRLYGRYNCFGAKTFRLTSNSPNLLNMPSTGSIYAKPIKRCFEAQQGYIFCMVDYGQLEDRVMANLSKDKNKCSLFLDGLDGHCLNSYYYFQKEIEDILPRNPDETLHNYIIKYKKAVDDGDSALKAIRSRSKRVTFGLSYGAMPKKVSQTIKCDLKTAEHIYNKYHNELYSDITKMRNEILKIAKQQHRIHLGLGCYLYTDRPERDIRTLSNSVCQFWSILTLLTIDKINDLIKEKGFQKKIEVVSSIYDSIYFHVVEDPAIIHWLNTELIPIMTKNFLIDTIVPNTAELECGYNWADTVAIPNNASIFDIKAIMQKAQNLFRQNV